jgi:hypothetical protein
MSFARKRDGVERTGIVTLHAFGRCRRGDREREIDVAVGDRAHGLCARSLPLDRHVRCESLHLSDHAGEQRGNEIGDREPEHTRARSRIERLGRCHDALDAAQDRPQVLDQVLRERARSHSTSHLDEQRITELLAQPRQRVTHRRLRAAEACGRSRDAALGHQHLERDEEVEVEAGQIDLAHDA